MKVIGYLSLGFPTLEKSIEMADWYVEGGCDAIEISLPSPNPKYEKETIRTWMQQAYSEISDYEVYFAAVKKIREKHPDIELYSMVYGEVLDLAGADSYANFCIDAKIDSVISVTLSPSQIEVLNEKKVPRCSFGSMILDPKRLEMCKQPGGLIYQSTAFFPGQEPVPGYETLDKVIAYMREIGITRPIYCGGGIKTPQDVLRVKEAGADGFFIGSALIELWDDPKKLIQSIKEYKRIAKD